jgi:type I restriction enzyme, R subunit
MSEFSQFKQIAPSLAELGLASEQIVVSDPKSALEKLSDLSAFLIRVIFHFEGFEPSGEALSPAAMLNRLNNRGFMPTNLLPFFRTVISTDLAKDGAQAVLEKRFSVCLKLCLRLVNWFVKSYGPFLSQALLQADNEEDILKSIKANPPNDGFRRSARKSAVQRANNFNLSEEETRVIIDDQLKSAGWEADTWALRYSLGTRPEKNVSKAISEWPTQSGPADYALFSGLDFIGVVEAKKMGKDVLSDLLQSKRYSRDAQLDGDGRFLGGPWGEYRVPFLFSTNARPYLEQLKEKSGIWFLDVRSAIHHPRPLRGWYSAQELMDTMAQDIASAHKQLEN